MTVDEAKFYPTANPDPAALEPGELPQSYGRNRLVLLPVDPYLMYAYWELASDPPPTAGARAVLRFHEQSHPFDVEVDLDAGKSYVHLWSSAKVYQADLGLRGEDGSFIPLAQSNTVGTPPSQPVPPEPPAVPRRASPPLSAGPTCTTGFSLSCGDSLQAAPPAQPAVFATEEDRLPVAPQPDITVQWQRKLEELFGIAPQLSATHPPTPEQSRTAAIRLSETQTQAQPQPLTPDPLLPEPEDIEPPPPFHLDALEEMDLTQYAEERFSPGISSGVHPSQGGPLDQ